MVSLCPDLSRSSHAKCCARKRNRPSPGRHSYRCCTSCALILDNWREHNIAHIHVEAFFVRVLVIPSEAKGGCHKCGSVIYAPCDSHLLSSPVDRCEERAAFPRKLEMSRYFSAWIRQGVQHSEFFIGVYVEQNVAVCSSLRVNETLIS